MNSGFLKKQVWIVTFLSLVFVGCSEDAYQHSREAKNAFFIESGVDAIIYKSIPFEGVADINGSFEYYDTEATSFYINNFLIGSIVKINADGYVFLQDIMGVDREKGLKDQGVANLSRILLAVNDNIMDENQTKLLNDFDIKDASEANVTALFIKLDLADINQTYALNHVEYYYKLIKKAPIAANNLSYITKSLKMEMDTTSVIGLLGDSDKINNVDVYMDGIYQGHIEKDVNNSRFSLQIELIGNLDRARSFDIIFKTDKTRTDTINYTSPKFTITVPSPMLGRWIDSQTREIVYLKDESELKDLSFTTVNGIMDINQLTDTNNSGRYLLRSGLGDVNLYGTIKKLSTDANVVLKTIDMKIVNVDANISEEFRLRLADVNNSAGSIVLAEDGSKTLYVDGNTTELTIPKITDVSIKDIRAITGQVDIYVKESDANLSVVSIFRINDVVHKNFDIGTLNITDTTIDYNVVSSIKEGNDYLYYGYDELDVEDKQIFYNKTIEVCNNGSNNISAATIIITNSNPALFKTFDVDTSNAVGEINSLSCKDIPIAFSFYKPVVETDINLTINVNSNSVDWSDHKRLTLSNETFIKLNFTSVDGNLNGFVLDDETAMVKSTIITQDGSSSISLPRFASKAYKIAVAPQSANNEEAFLVETDVISSKKDLNLYLGAEDNETYNNIYVESEKGYDTLALRYGEVKAYINYEDIDYLTLDSIPAVTAKYIRYKVDSNISTKTDIVIPFYLNIDTATLSNIKIYDGLNEVNITRDFNTSSKTVTLSSTTAFDTTKIYTLKVEAGLKGSEDTNATLKKNIKWQINFKATKLVSSGQEEEFGVSMVQVRDNDNNIVTDINTKLIWQDNNDSRSIVKEQSAAKTYCTDLETPYSSNWRLPTRDELLTLVDYTHLSPAMNDAFKYTVADGKYWTSTIKYADSSSAWLVDFNNGMTSSVNNVSSKENVRCVVDSADTNGTNFYLNSSYIKPTGIFEASDFITDTNGTYLLVQDDTDAGTLVHTYENAKSYCEALVLNDGSNNLYSDWRLPTIKELTTIIDDTVGTSTTPAIDIHFENVKATAGSKYWSATSDASNVDKAWAVSFEYGTHELDLKSNTNYTRCVSRGGL